MTIVIEAKGLSKRYSLRHESQLPYSTLRDAIAQRLAELGSRFARRGLKTNHKSSEEFWALRDVDFSARSGDRLAIIGRNGAGKSTLLKILSRITEPSAGEVTIRGRVASLLEVGTGFHPELTGRENIFLNGAILGMSRADIRTKFEEIVSFAEVERFLDTPVKHYSSGMYVRLAFAVAAHLEPEILIIDEVLAVGDVHFQNKCLGKMEAIGKEGRTLIFVSHNMGAVERLCTSAMVLKDGKVADVSSDVTAVIRCYLGDKTATAMAKWVNAGNEHDGDYLRPVSFRLLDAEGSDVASPVRHDQEVWIAIEVAIRKLDALLNIGYAIYTELGELLYWTYHTDLVENNWPALTTGTCTLTSMLPRQLLNEGRYRVEMLAGLHEHEWLLEPGSNVPTIWIDVKGGLVRSPYWTARRPGLLAPAIPWHLKK